MGQTGTHCSDCYNKVGRVQDAQIKAAESDGKVPMTKEGNCCSCNKATVVIYFEGWHKPPHRRGAFHCTRALLRL